MKNDKQSTVGAGVGFESTVRVTGYLTRTDRVNNAKYDEITHREKHTTEQSK